jgi:hypothetical protein
MVHEALPCPFVGLLVSAHPEMAILPDIFVARKILSSKYQPYAPQGYFLRGVCGKIFHAPRSRPNFPISGWALVRELFGGFVAAAIDPGDFFRFVQSKNDIAELFVVVTGLFPDLRNADSAAVVRDDFQNPFRSVLGSFSGASGGHPPISGGKCPDEFFQAVEPPVDIVDVPFGGNVVIVHEKLDHGIKAYRFAFSLCHPLLLGVHRCGTLLLSQLPALGSV